jgi:endonuclease/exonuclease/phosphatase family metal-dependent hydrolase
MRVATWNVFHGRTVPPTRAALLPVFGAAIAAQPWDVCALQEVPPWWAAALGAQAGASVRTTRTSVVRSVAVRGQEAIHTRDPERLESGGAGANVLLIRPTGGVIDQHRTAVVRHLPHRRVMHAVRLVRPFGRGIWIANLHAHHRPEAAAAADVIAALRVAAGWAAGERLVLLGDLNLAAPQGLAAVEGFAWLHGHRVDHVLGRGLRSDGGEVAERLDAAPGITLADHRFVAVDIADA